MLSYSTMSEIAFSGASLQFSVGKRLETAEDLYRSSE